MSIDGNIKALVLQRTAIAPVVIKTTDETKFLQCEEMVGPRVEVIEINAQTVVDTTELDAGIEALGGLPLKLGVTDVTQSDARNLVKEEFGNTPQTTPPSLKPPLASRPN